MPTKICMAGVTGWTGKAIAAGILDAEDLTLTGALARKAAGLDVGDVLGRGPVGVTVTADLGAALDGAEVLIDYTHPDAVKEHARAAIHRRGVGLTRRPPLRVRGNPERTAGPLHPRCGAT